MDTKEAIKVQFMNEYARKVFSDITVKGLCAATPVARTTFYSYYNNTDEVRCEIEDELINGLLEVSKEVSPGNYPDEDRKLRELERKNKFENRVLSEEPKFVQKRRKQAHSENVSTFLDCYISYR